MSGRASPMSSDADLDQTWKNISEVCKEQSTRNFGFEASSVINVNTIVFLPIKLSKESLSFRDL